MNMRKIVWIVVLFWCVHPCWAEVLESEESFACGTWVLHHGDHWFVERATDGSKMAVDTRAVLLGCAGHPVALDTQFDKLEVAVRCGNSTKNEGGLYVREMQLICK